MPEPDPEATPEPAADPERAAVDPQATPEPAADLGAEPVGTAADPAGAVADRSRLERARARRPLWIVVLLLLLGSAALWGASRLPFGGAVVDRPGGGSSVRVDLGADRVPALVPVALLALAAVAAAVALSGVLRRVLGGVLVLAGLGVAVAVLLPSSDHRLAFLSATDYQRLRDATAGAPWGHALAVLGGAFLLVAGVLLVWRGARLPRLGGSYQTPGAAKAVRDPDRELWNALDHGDDPTDEPTTGGTPGGPPG